MEVGGKRILDAESLGAFRFLRRRITITKMTVMIAIPPTTAPTVPPTMAGMLFFDRFEVPKA